MKLFTILFFLFSSLSYGAMDPRHEEDAIMEMIENNLTVRKKLSTSEVGDIRGVSGPGGKIYVARKNNCVVIIRIGSKRRRRIPGARSKGMYIKKIKGPICFRGK